MESKNTMLSLAQAFHTKTISFLGAGSVVEAIIGGVLRNELVPASQIYITNRSDQERLQSLSDTFGVQIERDKKALIEKADILVLAIKPKDVAEACQSLRGLVRKDQLVISVIAGVSTDFLREWLGVECAIIRTMPNTSSAIGLSTTGMSRGRFADEEDLATAKHLFEAIGTVYALPEEELDIITGLSGSGPAYIYYMIEAMEKAGVEAGLKPEIARRLTVETVLGAAQMLLTTNAEPALLRKKITSPNGTTQAGLEVLDSFSFQEAVVSAVLRATERSRELGAQFN
ncbi:pyrroline-5-carboxylate reductase [Brevibacillus fluminis]|uniref:pyrroline-5-carboxylate reductase n=1 Tax=Brevibacillus fluminis TaxID=511487 RepID=UPI003F8CECEE